MHNNLEKLKALTQQLVEQDEVMRKSVLSTAEGLEQLRWLTNELLSKEAQLQESLAIWKLFLEIAENPIIISKNGVWIQLSLAWERITGWTLDEIKAMGIEQLIHPDDMHRTVAAREEVNSGRVKALRIVNRWRCKDGAYKTFNWTIGVKFHEGIVIAVAIAGE